MKIAVMTDSGSGLSPKTGRQIGIHVIPMPFFMDDQTYTEDVNIGREEFFQKLIAGARASTSQPSPAMLETAWDSALRTHDAVVYIPLTSGLSSTCENAQIMARDEKYAGRVFVADTRGVSVIQYMSCLDALRLAAAGSGPEEIVRILEGNHGKNSTYIYIDTLEYLRRGGRVPWAAASLATLLHIKPILKIDNGSRLDTFSKARTEKKCREIMIRQLHTDLEQVFHDPRAQSCHLAVAYSDSVEKAREFADEIAASFPDRKYQEVIVHPLPLLICCHTGPGALGCGFVFPA